MSTRNCLRNVVLVLLLFATARLCGFSACAADANVSVDIDGFHPSSVSIAPGERVWFIVLDEEGPYCVQSDTGAWTPWYLFDYGDGFGIQFNERGDYYYHDALNPWNTGVVHVGTGGGGNTGPVVSIVSPTDGAVLTEPASFLFEATATDPTSQIVSVDLYMWPDLLGTFYAAPFSTNVTGLAAGAYTLVAVAYDALGSSAMSSINITVQQGTGSPPSLGQPQLVSGQFSFQVSGLTVGKKLVLQSSSALGSLANWTSVATNDITAGTMSITRPATGGAQFFRIAQVP